MKIETLRYWIQAILPLVYDESLSYMEFLSKVCAKLNEVIKQVNVISENVDPDKLQKVIEDAVKEYITEDNYKQVVKEIVDQEIVPITTNLLTKISQLNEELEAETSSLQNQISNLTVTPDTTPNSAELINARVSVEQNNAYATLKERLDADRIASAHTITLTNIVKPSHFLEGSIYDVETGAFKDVEGSSCYVVPAEPSTRYTLWKIPFITGRPYPFMTSFCEINSSNVFVGGNNAEVLLNVMTGIAPTNSVTAFIVINGYTEALKGNLPVITKMSEKLSDSPNTTLISQIPYGANFEGFLTNSNSPYFPYYDALLQNDNKEYLTLNLSNTEAADNKLICGIFRVPKDRGLLVDVNIPNVRLSENDYICFEVEPITNRIIKKYTYKDFNDRSYIVIEPKDSDTYIAVNNFMVGGYASLKPVVCIDNSHAKSNLLKIGNATFDGVNDITLGNILYSDTGDKKILTITDNMDRYGLASELLADYLGTSSKVSNIYKPEIGYLRDEQVTAELLAESGIPELETYTDVIFNFGTRDLFVNKPLGNIGHYFTDADTIYGYIGKAVRTIKGLMPRAKLFLCLQPHVYNPNGTLNEPYFTMNSLNEALKNVAKMAGCFTIDLSELGFSPYNSAGSYILNAPIEWDGLNSSISEEWAPGIIKVASAYHGSILTMQITSEVVVEQVNVNQIRSKVDDYALVSTPTVTQNASISFE